MYRNALGLLGDLTYQYDGGGNRTSVGGSFARTLLPEPVPSASYDAANQQHAFGARTMTFDDNGNLLTLAEAAGTTTLAWDARKRLAALSGPTTGTFAYDAQGRRVFRDIGGEVREYQYDGVDIIQEGVNGADITYLRTIAIDEALTRTDTIGMMGYLAEALGSTVALTDASGAIATMYTYEPFGRVVSEGTSSTNPFQYTGRENDNTPFYYYRARYYHGTGARFIQEDPLKLAALHAYEYVGNNPIVRTDPLGLIACEGTWRMAGWDRSLNIVCICYWLCIPCNGPVIWSGNKRVLPGTFGILAHTGQSVTRGDFCFCSTKPGPETTCPKCPPPASRASQTFAPMPP